jgi:hypothetical protein
MAKVTTAAIKPNKICRMPATPAQDSSGSARLHQQLLQEGLAPFDTIQQAVGFYSTAMDQHGIH